MYLVADGVLSAMVIGVGESLFMTSFCMLVAASEVANSSRVWERSTWHKGQYLIFEARWSNLTRLNPSFLAGLGVYFFLLACKTWSTKPPLCYVTKAWWEVFVNPD